MICVVATRGRVTERTATSDTDTARYNCFSNFVATPYKLSWSVRVPRSRVLPGGCARSAHAWKQCISGWAKSQI
jgi:hypothetical protein